MKFLIITSLLTGAIAQSFDIAAALNDLVSDVNRVDTAINNYNGGDAAEVRSAALNIITNINTADKNTLALDSIDQTTALGLAAPVQSLGSVVKEAVNDIIAKKDILVANGQGSAIYSVLAAQESAASKFTKDFASKVPTAIQAIAANLGAPIASSLASGKAEFQDVAQSSSGSGSGSSSVSSGSSNPKTSATSSSTTPSSSSVTTGAASQLAGSSFGAMAIMAIVLAL